LGALGSEALLDLLDTDRERGEVLIELCKIARDDFTPTGRMPRESLDAPEDLPTQA
jgi:hypothetical protein